jgi:hypothetical protein
LNFDEKADKQKTSNLFLIPQALSDGFNILNISKEVFFIKSENAFIRIEHYYG